MAAVIYQHQLDELQSLGNYTGILEDWPQIQAVLVLLKADLDELKAASGVIGQLLAARKFITDLSKLTAILGPYADEFFAWIKNIAGYSATPDSVDVSENIYALPDGHRIKAVFEYVKEHPEMLITIAALLL